MYQNIKEKTVYDFLHLFLTGHLKRDELSEYMKEYLAQSPIEFRAHVMDNMVLLQDTFENITADVACKYEGEHEKWEEEDIMRMVAAHTKVKQIAYQQESEFFTISQASEILGVTRRSIQNYINQNKLRKEFINGKPMISGESVRSFFGK